MILHLHPVGTALEDLLFCPPCFSMLQHLLTKRKRINWIRCIICGGDIRMELLVRRHFICFQCFHRWTRLKRMVFHRLAQPPAGLHDVDLALSIVFPERKPNSEEKLTTKFWRKVGSCRNFFFHSGVREGFSNGFPTHEN